MNPQKLFGTLRKLFGPLDQTEVDAINASLEEQPIKALKKPEEFYRIVRGIAGALDQKQVDTIERLLAGGASWSRAWMAYGLATAWHEAHLTPQREWGLGKGRPYASAGKYGQPQYGRGLVQLTWDHNYEWADKALGLGGALLKNFDLALDPDIAARILLVGMADGAFCGRSLGLCLPDEDGTLQQFTEARRIINGTDKAAVVAVEALKFQAALKAGEWA